MRNYLTGPAVLTSKGAPMPSSSSALFRTVSAWATATTIGLLLFVGLAAPTASAADTCDNATLREQNESTELPDCRAYEMVSAAYKQGFVALATGFTDDGIVSYISLGSFAGNGAGGVGMPYLGARTPNGWETQALYPPLYTPLAAGYVLLASDMPSSVMALTLDPSDDDAAGIYVRDSNGGLTRFGPGGFQVQLASDDRISGDGRVVVFGARCDGDVQVWARVGGSASVAVSGSECTRSATDLGGLCNGNASSTYEGAADDGSRVFFTTNQQLVNDDQDVSSDLYACDIPDGCRHRSVTRIRARS